MLPVTYWSRNKKIIIYIEMEKPFLLFKKGFLILICFIKYDKAICVNAV